MVRPKNKEKGSDIDARNTFKMDIEGKSSCIFTRRVCDFDCRRGCSIIHFFSSDAILMKFKELVEHITGKKGDGGVKTCCCGNGCVCGGDKDA